MNKLAKHDRVKVLDLLTSRLAFERTGVTLYDSIIAKIRAMSDPDADAMPPALRAHRDGEMEHVAWLEQEVRALGGDVHAMTEMAVLEVRESSGIADIITDGDNEPRHLFHALLAAELADNAGWDLLVELADEANDRDAKKQFKKRLREEEEHLVFARRVVRPLARRDVLAHDVPLPTYP